MALEFNDTSQNGSGSQKIFRFTGDIEQTIGLEDSRINSCPNNLFIIDADNGRYIAQTDDQGFIFNYFPIINPLNVVSVLGFAETSDITWTPIAQIDTSTDTQGEFEYEVAAVRIDARGQFNRERKGAFLNDGGTVEVGADTIYSVALRATGLSVRETVSGSVLTIEVRGRNSQDWQWVLVGNKAVY